MTIPIRQYNIMDNIGNVGGGGYDDFQNFDFGIGPQQPTPTFPVRGALPLIGQEPVNTMDPRSMGPQEPNIAQLMQQFYTPETQATDAFNKLVQNAPQRNKPGIARRLAASAGALGAPKGKGIETAEQFMYAPFMRNTQDWMAKMDPNYKAASLENARNANERQLAGSMAQYTMGERKQAESERKNRADEKIRADRAAVYRFKAENPNIKIVTPKGGNITGIDPISGRSIPILDQQGRPISTGSLSDEDAINLRGEWSVDAARARGQASENVEGKRQEGREALAWSDPYEVQQSDGSKKWFQTNRATGDIREAKFPGNPSSVNKVGVPPRSGAGGGAGNELEIQRARVNKANELINTLPGANRWIKISNNGRVTVAPTTRFTSDADKALHARITQEIYGSGGQYTGTGTPGGGRGGGPGTGGKQGPTEVKKEYSPSRNQTRITYSDGTTKIINGRQ